MEGTEQRARILAAALDLIADRGLDGMTMRQLAAACDLNIATLYHYVPGKADLIAAIVDERRYDQGLRDLDLPIDPSLPPGPRLVALLTHVARSARGELRIWRLLIGEGLRGEPVARAEATRLSAALTAAVDSWLAKLFPEVAPARRHDVSSVVTGQLLAGFLDELLLDRGGDRLAARAEATAAAVFPSSS
ncbi:MAG TPA: helix-turn-helix domain-containing protein [Acidimicrobiales bacterium]|nr:helix-turn-helix domain-containing protein [Acidimicrobiales bacterium]